MFKCFFRRKDLKILAGRTFCLKLLFVVSLIFSHPLESIAQPSQFFFHSLKTPKSKIPADISPDLRQAIEALYSDNPIEVEKAASQLGEMGHKASPALPFLFELLDFPPVAAAYRDGAIIKVKPSLASAKAIGRIGDAETAMTMTAFFKKAITKSIATAEQRSDLVKPQTRMFSDRNLAQSELEQMDPIFLIDYDLEDVAIDVPSIAQALIALKSLASGPVIALLKDDNNYVVSGAAEVLGEIGDKSAVEPLIGALEKKKTSVVTRLSIGAALGKITGQRFGEDAVQWRKWWEQSRNNSR